MADPQRANDAWPPELDALRTVQGLERPTGPTWSPPLPPHTLENVGDAEIRMVSVEVKTGG